MSLTAPNLIGEHGLDAVKGWFEISALDYVAQLDTDAVQFTPPAGRVMHLDPDSGKLRTGCHNTGMSLFMYKGPADYDVSNPGITASGKFMHAAIVPGGDLAGLVASGGFELACTEFDAEQTYKPGDLLTAIADDEDADVGGVLTNESVAQYVDPICGVVSGGKQTRHDGVDVLLLWTVWLPGAVS